MRYTKTIAHQDLDKINDRLERLGHECKLRMSGRYNYQGLDLFNKEGTCMRTITTGTPRECINAASSYLADVAYGAWHQLSNYGA